MCAVRLLKKVLRDERGAVLIWAAGSLLMFFAFAAIAIDMGFLYVMRGQLQATADAAALAGVSQLPDEIGAVSEGVAYSEKNMPPAVHGTVLPAADVEIGKWEPGTRTFTLAGIPSNAVKVTTRRAEINGNPAPVFFAGLWGLQTSDVVAAAIAVMGPNPDANCLTALELIEKHGLRVHSGSVIQAPLCKIHVNTCQTTEAVEASSGSTVVSAQLCRCPEGGVVETSGSLFSPSPVPCAQIEDPLADIAPKLEDVDPGTGCDYTDFKVSNTGATVYPGVYCGGLSIESGTSAQLEPGTYVIKDGKLNVASNSTLVGEGVGFFLTGDSAYVDINSNTTVQLSAPTSGEMAGYLFVQDPAAAPGVPSYVRSNSGSFFEGTMYFPTQILKFESNSEINSAANWSMIVADRVEVQSGTILHVNSDFWASPVPNPLDLVLRLVD